MDELKFNSQVCTTREQSQRLLDLGLKPVTADCVVTSIGSKDHLIHTEEPIYVTESLNSKRIPNYPAWSLHRLLCLYGQDYTIKELYNNAEECYGMLISAIEIAIENDEFNKEYLKQ